MADDTRVWEKIEPSQFKQLVEEGIPSIKRTGLKVLEMKPGRVSLKLPLRGNENHIGIMYAGSIFTVAETPGGALHLTTFDVTRYVPVIKHMDIRFKRPARTDVSITVEMGPEEVERINRELEAEGKSDFVLNGEVKDADGTVVAETVATYQIRRIG